MQTKSFTSWTVATIACTALCACTRDDRASRQSTSAVTQGADCPMRAPGAVVETADTDKGIAMIFATDGGDIAALRQRVQQMAEVFRTDRGRGAMWHHMAEGDHMTHGGKGMMGHEGMGEHGAGTMAALGPMPAAKATVVETGKGARLELEPTDAAQLESLRQHVRAHRDRMHAGECWTLESEPEPPPEPQR